MAQERVVRPGQEPLVAEMLGRGAILPGQCAFTTGHIDGGLIRVTYTCPAGEVVLELREPGQAPPALAHTQKFAIGVRGPAPAELIDELQSRIRLRESAFAWSGPARDRGAYGGPANDGGSVLASRIGVLTVMLIGIAVAVALERVRQRGGLTGVLVAARRGLFYVLAVLLSALAVTLAAEAVYRVKLAVDVPRYAADTAFELYGVGESTMVGEPFQPKISVPRLLEHMFAGSIAGRPMVITNLAERGAPLYPQSAAFERALASRKPGAPGVVLIMSGHNEAFMDAAPGTWRPYVPSLIADRSAIVRDILLALRRRRVIGRERSPAVYEYYLRRVIETAQANGILPILATMASNISRIEPNIEASAAESVVATVEQGRALEAQHRHAQARDIYLSRLTTDPSSAALYYRAGRCEEALGNFAAAREYYWAAVDRDPRLLFGRATRLQNQLVRQLAREYGVPLVDGVRILEDHSPNGLLGDEVFMDGQHPTIDGYLHVANAYARILSEHFDTPLRHPLRDEGEAARALGFGPEDLSGALVSAGSWLIATSVTHPFPYDRMALAEKRFAAVLGKGDDFSAWVGIALTQAAVRGGLLRSPDEVRELPGLIGYMRSYSVRSSELPSVLDRFQKFGVDESVLDQLRRAVHVNSDTMPVRQSRAGTVGLRRNDVANPLLTKERVG